MEELAVWHEVIRALLPQSCVVRLVDECGVIIVGSAHNGELVYLTEESLGGRLPTDVVRDIENIVCPTIDPYNPERVVA